MRAALLLALLVLPSAAAADLASSNLANLRALLPGAPGDGAAEVAAALADLGIALPAPGEARLALAPGTHAGDRLHLCGASDGRCGRATTTIDGASGVLRAAGLGCLGAHAGVLVVAPSQVQIRTPPGGLDLLFAEGLGRGAVLVRDPPAAVQTGSGCIAVNESWWLLTVGDGVTEYAS